MAHAPNPAEMLIAVVINRDFWKEDDTGKIIRYRAGTEIKVPIEFAFEGIESGALTRVKK